MPTTEAFTYKKEQVFMDMQYYANGQSAITLLTIDGEVQAVATVAIDVRLAEDEIAIKNYSENEGMLEFLQEVGIIKPPHRFVPSGYVNIPICRIAEDARYLWF